MSFLAPRILSLFPNVWKYLCTTALVEILHGPVSLVITFLTEDIKRVARIFFEDLNVFYAIK